MPMLDGVARDVARGRFAWPGGGRPLMSTVHVRNVVACAAWALTRAPSGRAYAVTDGTDQTLREVFTALLATRGLRARGPSAPLPLAWPTAAALEALWRALPLKGEPPLTRQMLRMVGHDFTLDDRPAREDLGYSPVVTWPDGLAEMGARTRAAA